MLGQCSPSLDVFYFPLLLNQILGNNLSMTLRRTLFRAQEAEWVREVEQSLNQNASRERHQTAIALAPLGVSPEEIAEFHQGYVLDAPLEQQPLDAFLGGLCLSVYAQTGPIWALVLI